MATTKVSIPIKAFIEGRVFVQVGDLEPEAVGDVTIPIQLGATSAELGSIELTQNGDVDA